MLDTVFVTDEGIRHDHDSWSRVLTDLPETYVDLTMLATYAWGPGAELRFYSGATPRRPTNGHVQCPADQHNHPCHRKETTRASGTPPTRRDGRPLPASMRAVEPSRVLKLSVKVFHTLAAMAPQVSATVGAAALERQEMLRAATAQPLEPAMFVIGPPLDPRVHAAESFLHRNQTARGRLPTAAPGRRDKERATGCGGPP